ncbi:MAG: tetratricopeptide repeat protein [Acidobacteria bacterium]|nr:tetratricopeptide repeat protein [Acidobacteriota bacterium]
MSRFLGWPLALAVTLAVAVAAVLAVVSITTERNYGRLVAAGDTALAAADLSTAIEAYTGAITLNPDSTAAHLKRGLAYRQRRELEAALRDLRRASELDPSAPRVFEWQGDVNLDLGRFARAAEHYAQSVRLDDRQPDVHYKLAVARYRDGSAGAAVEPLRRAIALAPDHARAHYMLGLCLRDLVRLDEASEALGTAARLAPGLLAVREARADVFQARGQTGRAVDELSALAALEPERAERAVAVAAAYARASRYDAAVLALGRAAERFPDSAVVFTALGAVWMRAAEGGDSVALDKALAALTRAAAMSGVTGETLALLGQARLRAGDLAGAERDLQAAVLRVPVRPDAYRALADVLERRNRPAEALDALARFAALAAGTPPAGAVAPRLGDLAMRVGDPHGAAYWYERAMAELGPSASLHLKLAEADVSRGDRDHARKMVTEGLALEPGHARLRALAKTLGRTPVPQ